MSDDWDPTKICRDEECEIEEVHRAHRRLKRRPVLHHRPKERAPLSIERGLRAIERGEMPTMKELLAERVLAAVGKRPTFMAWIQRDVRDDYGHVSERSIYRYVGRLIADRRIVKLDLGLTFAVYIDPTSPMLSDRSALREYMLANVDCIPTCTKEAFA